VPIYRINLTLLLSLVFVTDPIIRAYPALGRFMLKLRVFLFVGMVIALYFGAQHFTMSGMIAIVVVISLIEKIISETVIIKKLGITSKDFIQLKEVGKTAIVSLLAGIVAFAVYYAAKDAAAVFVQNAVQTILPQLKVGLVNFIGGGATLFLVFVIFAPIYLLGMNFWNAIDDDEKAFIRNSWAKVFRRKRML